MARKYWWPRRIPAQMMVVLNFKNKIEKYQTVLGLAPETIVHAHAICDAFIGACDRMEQSRVTMIATTAWRDIVLYGEKKGSAAPPPPKFIDGGSPSYTCGVVAQILELREQIVVMPGYSDAIGEDLGIIGSEKARPDADQLFPNLKFSVMNGDFVNVKGSMKGMDAVRIEYTMNGHEFRPAAFLTATPGGFQIKTTELGKPEKVALRSIFIKRNNDFGVYSHIDTLLIGVM